MPRYVATDHGLGILQSDGNIGLINTSAAGLDELLMSGLTPEALRELPVVTEITADGVHLRAPVSRPTNLWAVGYGYAEHSAEVGRTDEADEPPVLFQDLSRSRARLRTWLHRRQRRQRTRRAARALQRRQPRSVEGQELRHLHPAGTMHLHARRVR
jgi:2-keto-4-pentenoate hydratase/2-oxohepta-3-ene-1,7-dioic acid hydratase in catechol pathway